MPCPKCGRRFVPRFDGGIRKHKCEGEENEKPMLSGGDAIAVTAIATAADVPPTAAAGAGAAGQLVESGRRCSSTARPSITLRRRHLALGCSTQSGGRLRAPQR